MDIVKGNIGNALHSVAPDHVLGVAADIYDEEKGQYQSEINVAGEEGRSALDAKTGYYECSTASATAAKTVSAQDYVLANGGSIKIKMTNKNTASSGVTLKIGTADAKALYYDGNPVSATNAWEDGETVEVYYDGTNYYANNVAGGTFATGEKVKDIGIDDEPTLNSNNLVESSGVKRALNAQTIVIPQVITNPTSTAWIYDYQVEEGKTYVVKHLSGDRANIAISSFTGPVLITGEWVEYTPPASGKPFTYMGALLSDAPVVQFMEKDSGINTEISGINTEISGINTKITEISFKDDSLFDIEKSGSLNAEIYKKFRKAVKNIWVYNATEGLYYSIYLICRNITNQSLTNDYQIYLYIKDDDGNELSAYMSLKTRIDWSVWDGKLIRLSLLKKYFSILSNDFDLNVIPNKIVVDVDYSNIPNNGFVGSIEGFRPIINANHIYFEDYEDFENISNEIDEIKDEIKAHTVDSVAASTGTSFVFNFEVKAGVTYYVKHVSGFLSNFATTSADQINLVTGKFIEFTAVTTGRPYSYVGSIDGKTAPVVEIYESGTLVDDIKKLDKRVTKIEENPDAVYHVINVSRDGTSKNGRTIHFSGLTAISDAINSITDASAKNRYIIHVEGMFCFTNPLSVPMYGGYEYSIIFMKDYIDIEGDGSDRSGIIMDFVPNATFHEGKAYSDYQPIYFYSGGHKISNMKIVGRNCRYAFHIEAGSGSGDKTIDIENCEVEYQGHPDYSGGYGDCFGTGMNSGQVWNIKNCVLRNYAGSAFTMHTPLSLENARKSSVVNFENCKFIGNISFHNYQVENNTFVNFKDCEFGIGKVPCIGYSLYKDRAFAKTGNYITVLIQGANFKAIYSCGGTNFNKGDANYGAVLRVKSLSTGNTSVVRFDQTSSAFLAMVGDGIEQGNNKTVYGWDCNYGYVYRDGGADISGQAFGTLDVDETALNNISLGKLLGDCSETAKTLGVTIDSTTYTVTFNEDYTSQDNAYVLNVINGVIGAAGVADVFSPAILYYPNINGLSEVKCNDSKSILRGMGVVILQNGVRRAKNSDGYIDGIALDDIAEGQYGRIITKGYIYTQVYRTALYAANYFTTLDNSISQETLQSYGISDTQDGVFKAGQSPILLKGRRVNIAGADSCVVEIVE